MGVGQFYCGCFRELQLLAFVTGFTFDPDAVVALEHRMFLLAHVYEILETVV